MIILYGTPHIAKDSEKIIISWIKKEVITHSAEYTQWRNCVLKQLRLKYRNSIEEGSTIRFVFNLNKKETKDRLFDCSNDLIKCMVESKMFKNFVIVTPKIKQNIIDGCANVEISF
jgi:hypothetical protein